MKNHKSIYLLLSRFILLFMTIQIVLSSCSHNKEKVKFTKFNKEYMLSAKVTNINEVYKSGLLCFYDTLMFITRTPSNNYQIHIYSKDYKYIASTGRTGRGPGEITNPFFATVNKTTGILYYLDMGKKKIHKFPIDSIIKNPAYLSDESKAVSIPDKIPIILQFYPMENNLFSCANYFSDSTIISFFNEKGQVVDSLSIKKSSLLENTNSKNKIVPRVTFLYKKHPTKELYVIAHKYSDILTIIDNSGNIIANIQGPDMINYSKNLLKANYKSAYDYLECDNEYIYALYNGKNIVNKEMIPNYAQTIHVFNWNGKPIARVALSQSHSIFSLQYNPKRIVSFSQSSGEIVYYNLPPNL